MTHATTGQIYLGLAQIVAEVDPTIPIILQGVVPPNLDTADDWVSFTILSIIEGKARRDVKETFIDTQIVCYSRHSSQRKDNKITAVYDLADKYTPLFDRKDVLIKSSCIQFKENKIIPLDLRSTGDFAQVMLQQLPTINTMALVILNQGIISSTKE